MFECESARLFVEFRRAFAWLEFYCDAYQRFKRSIEDVTVKVRLTTMVVDLVGCAQWNCAEKGVCGNM